MNDPHLRTKNRRWRIRQLLAWSVHFYTALGLVAAAGMAVLIVQGGAENFRWAFLLMLAAWVIDGTDGTLARRVRVKEVLPGFDGRRLDDLIDWLTYTCLPLLLVWRAEVLPAGQGWWLLAPLLASAYGFCQVSVKTDDGYFLGFPSYWNLVAFYLYVLRPPAWCVVLVLVVLSLLTFVPTRYLYPSYKPGRLSRLTTVLAAVWAGMVVMTLFRLPAIDLADRVGDELTRLMTLLVPSNLEGLSPVSAGADEARRLALVSLFFPVYYMAVSWLISLRLWRRARRRRKEVRTALS